MSAWTAQVTSAAPSGQNLSINLTFFLATDTGLTTPLTSTTISVPASTSPANIQKQIIATGTDLRTSYNLISTYTGTTVAVP